MLGRYLETLEADVMLTSVSDNILEDKNRSVLKENSVEIEEYTIQNCHQLKKKEPVAVKFVNRRNYFNILIL